MISAWKKDLTPDQCEEFKEVVKSESCRLLIEQYTKILEADKEAILKAMVDAKYEGDWEIEQASRVAELKNTTRGIKLFNSLLT